METMRVPGADRAAEHSPHDLFLRFREQRSAGNFLEASRTFGVLWRNLESRTRGFLLSRQLSEDAADDLLQEVAVRMITNADSFEEGRDLHSWVFGIARHLSLDHFRGCSRMKKHIRVFSVAGSRAEDDRVSLESLAVDHTRPEDSLCEEELQTQMEKLPPDFRQVLEMRCMKALSYDQMAMELGKSPAACRLLVMRARQELRRLLECAA